MKLLTYLLLSQSFLLINSLVESEGWQLPKNLSKIKKVYESGKISTTEKPIIAFSNIYFIYDYYTNIYNLDTKEKSILPPKIYRKPLLYTNTIFSFYSLFLTKDRKIHIYEEDGKKNF